MARPMPMAMAMPMTPLTSVHIIFKLLAWCCFTHEFWSGRNLDWCRLPHVQNGITCCEASAQYNEANHNINEPIPLQYEAGSLRKLGVSHHKSVSYRKQRLLSGTESRQSWWVWRRVKSVAEFCMYNFVIMPAFYKILVHLLFTPSMVMKYRSYLFSLFYILL